MKLLVSLVLLVGCATVPVMEAPMCPPEDIIILHPGFPEHGIPPLPMEVDEGSLVPGNYWTVEEWDQFVLDQMKQYQDFNDGSLGKPKSEL